MAALSCIHRGYARTERRTPASVRWSLIGEMAAAPWASDYRLPKQVHAHSDLLTHVSGYGEAPWVISHGGCVRVTTRSIASVSPVLLPDSRVRTTRVVDMGASASRMRSVHFTLDTAALLSKHESKQEDICIQVPACPPPVLYRSTEYQIYF